MCVYACVCTSSHTYAYIYLTLCHENIVTQGQFFCEVKLVGFRVFLLLD